MIASLSDGICKKKGKFLLDNIILIGMPGCGKSTIGIVLAKVLGFHFLDTDLLIQAQEGRLLHEILEQDGVEAFNEIENRVNASIQSNRTVIATGGSVIYGKEAMEHLKSIGKVVYLRVPLDELEIRLGDFAQRGVSMKDGQTLEGLFEERKPYYEQHAHLTVDVGGLDIREAVGLICEKYEDDI